MDSTYTSNGAKLAFRESGAGLPIVFLHPTPLDGRFWQPLIEKLRDEMCIRDRSGR